ncbi:MAG: dihydrodipicolinate synthase family protein [Pseudomonadota bacterium]
MTTCTGGVWAATLTPMNTDLSIDLDRLNTHVFWLLDRGCDGVALLGTTGEANSLSLKERLAVIDAAGAAAFPADKIMTGVGCCAAGDTLELSRAAIAAGYPNLLMLPPFYYKGVSEEGLFRSYANIIEELNDDRARIIVYDFPQMTGLEISADLLVRLREAFPDTVIGIKDSSGNWDDMKEACDRLPGFSVFAGTEKYLLPVLRAGGAGCISATANVTSPALANLMANWRNSVADELQEVATELRIALQKYPPAPALKELMAISTGEQRWRSLRPPMVNLINEKIESLRSDLHKIDFDVKDLSKTTELRSTI